MSQFTNKNLIFDDIYCPQKMCFLMFSISRSSALNRSAGFLYTGIQALAHKIFFWVVFEFSAFFRRRILDQYTYSIRTSHSHFSEHLKCVVNHFSATCIFFAQDPVQLIQIAPCSRVKHLNAISFALLKIIIFVFVLCKYGAAAAAGVDDVVIHFLVGIFSSFSSTCSMFIPFNGISFSRNLALTLCMWSICLFEQRKEYARKARLRSH